MKNVYADYNATAPCPPGHYEQLAKNLEHAIGNPSSIHYYGRSVKLRLEEAREQVANLFGGERKNIIFTSGASESNNLALQGVIYNATRKPDKKPHIIVSTGEHSSVLRVVEALVDRNLCSVSYVPLKREGFVDNQALLELLTPETTMLALIYVNNETGVVNPLPTLIEQVRSRVPKIHIHVDAVQAYGKIDCNWIHSSSVDTASASAHKIGGFKGVGCLYKKAKVNLTPIIFGGGQERGLRSGTENMQGIVSFGIRAQELAAKKDWIKSLDALKMQILEGLKKIPDTQIHGDPVHSIPTTVNFSIKGFSAEELLLAFDNQKIAVSSGSACSSGGDRPSHVLKAMGYSDEEALQAIRISFGEGSQIGDADAILKVLFDLSHSKNRSSDLTKPSGNREKRG